MGQKRHSTVHNRSKVFDLINFLEGRPINRINELNGPHITLWFESRVRYFPLNSNVVYKYSALCFNNSIDFVLNWVGHHDKPSLTQNQLNFSIEV
jgi:hypothetical protein